MSDVTPADERYAERARENFAKHGAMTHIGARLVVVQPGRVVIELPFRPEVSQQHGYFHAGMTAAVADTAGGIAALTLFDEHSEVLTVEFKMNLLAPARGERLTAEGRVVRSGKTLTVCTVDVVAHDGDRAGSCALMQMTLFRIAKGR